MKSLSLKLKLVCMTLAIVLALGLSTLVLMRSTLKVGQREKIEQFRATAVSLSDAIGAQFYERYGDVQAFAGNKGLQSKDRGEIVAVIDSLVALYGIYDLVMVVDARGRLVAVNSKGPDGKPINSAVLSNHNYSDAPWFKATMEGRFTEDKEKNYAGTYFESAHVDPYTTEVLGQKSYGTSFTAQVKNADGTVIGVVTNRAGARWFAVAFQEVYENLRSQKIESTDLTLTDRDGKVLFSYHPKAAGKTDPVYDFEALGKFNLFASGHEAGAGLKEGRDGGGVATDPRHKEAYVYGFTPVNGKKFPTAVGWNVIAQADYGEALSGLVASERLFYLVFGIVLAISVTFSVMFSSRLSRSMGAIAQHLWTGSVSLSGEAEQISSASTELSESATEQAAALQETVSAIEEVSSMVAKNADNAANSMKQSAESERNATRGKETVDEMIKAIEEINRSNNDIMAQITDSNQRISEIVKVIGEIGNKTKVINEIVFQTKLLSFNASVEAARAGEHGKGFAVVAEEVGNLAQMSGQAAQEISSMLDAGMQKVQTIVEETKSKVETLVAVGKEKVEAGTEKAHACGKTLDEVMSSVKVVNQMVQEIAVASQEQSQGVQEINKAMTQLDQVTQQNTAVSQKSARAAEKLAQESETLKRTAQDLMRTVHGNENAAPAVETAPAPARSERPAANVLHMKDRSPKASAPAPAEPAHESRPAARQIAAGAENVPLSDDPRFEDV